MLFLLVGHVSICTLATFHGLLFVCRAVFIPHDEDGNGIIDNQLPFSSAPSVQQK